MTSSCAVAVLRHQGAEALYNVSELFEQRYQNSPKEDRDRLKRCWGYTDCGDCHRSEGHCGWCPISSTCLPLPLDPLSRTFPLLTPIRYKFICALGPERFELRTSGLGCQVSTITFLTAIVTIFCTMFGLAALHGFMKLFQWFAFALRARRGGYMVFEDGTGRLWVRNHRTWSQWWRKLRGKEREFEIENIEEVWSNRGRWWSNQNRPRTVTGDSASTPLLGQ